MQEEFEIMRVLRLPPRGTLAVELGNGRYAKIDEIPETQTRQMLLVAIGELVSFADGYENLVDAGIAPPLQPQVPISQEVPEPKLDSEVQKTQFIAKAEREPAVPEKKRYATAVDIVAQIDAILQHNIASDAALYGRRIRLEQDPTGGLRIRVDHETYHRPQDVEDRQVRQIIQRSLQEWDQS